MAKVRVFEAAKQHGYEVQDLLDALVNIGVKVRSHLSPVDEAEVTKAMATLGGSKAPGAAEAQAKPRTVVRRRRKTGDDESAAEETAAAPAGEASAATADELPTEEVAAPGEATEATATTAASETAATEAAAPAGDQEAQPESVQPPAAAAEASAETPPEEAAAGEPEAKEEFGLKVVRFIHPPVEETTTVSPAAAAPSPYHMSKKEREARRAEKKVKGRKKGRRPEVETAASPRRSMQKTQITVPKASKRKIRINEVIAVSDLSQRLGVKATELIKQLMALGVLVTINQTIDADTAALVAAEFDYEVENIVMGEEAILAQAEDKAEDLVLRSPVVTVMGHVDHGKTSLLDRIRETRVAAGEAGGITQHIGAYAVETNRGRVVFLDTPGHEAFTALRARGAQVTDITVLVVAANDGIMPQTVEAIAHSKAAGVPIIVAINKMDLPDANPDRVKRELTEHELAPEGWGGDVICVPLSAKTGEGVDNLLEMIALQSEILELKANPNKPAHGTVVEARVDRGRGVVATVLIQEGTLKVGDIALAGQHYGRVRLIFNDAGKRLKEAGPSTPVEVAGLSGVPVSGEPFVTVENERVAKDIASRRTVKAKADEQGKARKITLADFHQHLAAGAIQDLPIIIKADVHGSMEALGQSLAKLSTGEVKVNVIHSAVGGITENDVNLASASNAIIIGFNVRPEAKAAAMASEIGVDIRLYSVIYDASDDVKKAMEGLLAPTIEEKNIGRAEVRQIFRVPKAGTVAGCYVTQGVIQRNARVRLLRDNVVVFTGELDSLKRFKDDAKEVREGFECGLSIVNYNDIKEGDTLEFFVLEEIRRTL